MYFFSLPCQLSWTCDLFTQLSKQCSLFKITKGALQTATLSPLLDKIQIS